MIEATWEAIAVALDGQTGRHPIRFWLRDDDAVDVTSALDRLAALTVERDLPLLLAAIPAGVTPALGAWAAARSLVTPCQHGYRHRNHASAGEKACELGGWRDDETVLGELAAGRAAMDRVFGPAWARILVPPWNRIRPTLLPHLAAAGYAALSTFAGGLAPTARQLPHLDCDLDIIDWRHGRGGRTDADIVRRLLGLIEASRDSGAPIGLLAHHLAHDAQAWHILERLLPLLRDHPGAVVVTAAEALAAPA